MFGLIAVGLALVLFWLAGVLVLHLIGARGLSPGENLSLGLGLGAGLIAWQMLVMGLVNGLPLSAPLIIAPWVLAWAIYLLARRPWRGWKLAFAPLRPPPASRMLVLEMALALGLLTLVGAVAFRSTFLPIWEWDGWAIWDLKARAFFFERGLTAFLNDPYYLISAPDYPLFSPLAGAFVYLLAGHPDAPVLLLTAAFYAALLGLFYTGLRETRLSRAWALAFTLLLAAMPNLLFWSQQFYAEVFLLYYTLGTMLALWRYWRNAQTRWLYLAALFAGLATQVKIEGLLMIAPAALSVGWAALRWSSSRERRSAWQAAAVFVFTVALLDGPWLLYSRVIADLTPPVNFRLSVEDAQRLWLNVGLLPRVFTILGQWLSHSFFHDGFYLVFPLVTGWSLWRWRSLAADRALAYLTLHTLWLVVPSLLYFTAAGPQWLDPTRPGRYWLPVTGAACFLLALAVADEDGRAGWIRRVVLGYLLLVAILGGLGDALNVLPSALPFSSRPVSLLRQINGEAGALLPVSAAERRQLLDAWSGRADYGRLLHVAQAVTPAQENLAFYTPPDNQDQYLRQRSYYLLFPRRVFMLHAAAEITPEALRARNIGTVIVYERELQPGEFSGQKVFETGVRFSVFRINVTESSFRTAPGFVAAPVRFSNGINLEGYQIVDGLLDEALLVMLYWRADQAVNASYTVFVHLWQQDVFLAQHDSIPGLGQVPTFAWTPGGVVVDAHTLRLVLSNSQRAQARFCLGLYGSTTLERVPILSADGYAVQDNTACRPFSQP